MIIFGMKDWILYDQYADGTLCKTKGIGAYWALFTNVLDTIQLNRMIKELDNPETFNRKFRVPSLSADHPKYKENGRYWQGGIWPGTNYMVIQGLVKKGYRKLAREIALNHYNEVLEVYKNTGTFGNTILRRRQSLDLWLERNLSVGQDFHLLPN